VINYCSGAREIKSSLDSNAQAKGKIKCAAELV